MAHAPLAEVAVAIFVKTPGRSPAKTRLAADFAATHRIRLAGQRERAGARATDLSGGQMQMDQRRVVVRPVR